jgi:tRNA threonylcarbamoyladenosine biosynthesis protein TsaE
MSAECIFTIHAETELASVAQYVRDHLESQDLSTKGVTLVLTGDLGAGKTTFVKYLAEAFSMDPADVSSPTYVLERVYTNKLRTLSHWDLYRLQGLPEELYEDPGAGTVRLIEWGERFVDLKPEGVLKFELQSDGKRVITVNTGKNV